MKILTAASRTGFAVRMSVGFLGLLIFSSQLAAISPPNGVAPVVIPAGGFAIEGNLLANTPTSGVGDWIKLTNFPGAGGGVLGTNGVPLNAATTFHFVDPYNTNTDSIFTSGNNPDANPNTWTWGVGIVQTKEDLNNGLLHLGRDTNDHAWLIVSADHTGSGDADMYFNFFQNTLTKNTNGTFTSAGPHGGFTTNDLRLKLNFSGNSFSADQWRTNPSGGGYQWVDVTTSLPTNRVFLAVNSGNAYVPYGAFGSTNYSADLFIEAAVDLTALFGNINPCASAGFKTVLITTLHPSGDMSDFINPFQAVVNVGLAANAGPDQTNCYQGSITTFNLNGSVSVGGVPSLSTNWTVVSGNATIISPGSLTTAVQVPASIAGTNVTLRLTVTSTCSNKTDDIVLTVAPQSACAISGPAKVCPGSSNQFTVPAGNSYTWSISGSAAISGPTNQRTVTVLADAVCGQNFTLNLTTVTSNLCLQICSTTVAVNDTNPPAITCPTNRVLECPADTGTNATGVATATDGCGFVTISYSDRMTNGCGSTFVISRTWTAVDFCGNSNSCVQTITVRDTRPPVLTCPTNRVLECPADTSTNATGVATATDTCGSATVSYSDVSSNGCGNTQVILRTWRAVDTCGNSNSCVQTIAVRDTTPPLMMCPTNISVQCLAGSGTNATGIATASDLCGTVVIGYSDVVTNTGAGVTNIFRTWTATDQCGNATNCTQTVTVRDTTAPAITCPATVIVNTGSNLCTASGVSLGSPVVSDNCGVATVTSNAPAAFPLGTNIVTWTVTDAGGNSNTCQQRVIVRDNQTPTISCPGNLAFAANAGACSRSNVTYTVNYGDNCTPVLTQTAGLPSGATFPPGVTTNVFVVTDPGGNSNTCAFTVTITDTEPPAITCPPELTVSANSGCGATNVLLAAPVTADNCAVASFASNAPPLFSAGTNLVTWTVTDTSGNSNTCVQRVIVRDMTSPTIACPADVIVSANSGCGATNVALNSPVTSDNCAVATVTSNAPAIFTGGTNLVTWTVTDTSGNSNTCVQRVIVRDTTNPTITCSADVVVSANSGCGATNVLLAAPVTADNCAVAAVTSNVPPLFSAGTNLVTWTVTDTGGNSNTCIQRVIVRDTTSPTITCPADVIVSANSGCGATNVALGPPVTADNCAVATVTSNAPSLFNAGTNLVTWTVTDTSGNSNICVQRVIVRDTTSPTITCPADVNVPANSGCGATNVALGTPVTADNCAVATVTSNGPALFAGGTNLVTWAVTDTSGNSNTCVQRVIVRDTANPTITCPADVNVPANSGCGATNVALGTPVTADDCVVASVTSNAPPLFSAGTNLVTWTVRDISGNSNTCVQRVIVRDTTNPNITCPADVIVSANSGCGATNVALGPPITADNCAVATVTSNAPSLFNAGTNLVTWTVTDTSGNSNICVQRVIVRDTTNPTITCPADVVVSANSGCGATNVVLGTPITADNCAVATVTSNAPSLFNAGTNLVTWTVTDTSGNSNTCVQRVIVRDTTNPTITCPADVTVSANSGCGATNVTLGTPATTDNCAVATVTSNVPPLFSAGTNLVTWTVRDPSGNSNTCVQRVIVRDTTNPTITCPADVIVSANSGCGATNVALGPPITADNCAVATVTSNAPPLFTAGTNLVTWTVTDTSGNSNTCVQRVIVRDTTNPTITCPADITVSANSGCGATNVTLGTPVTADNCAVATVTSNAPSLFTTGTNLVTWTVRDTSGNSNTCVQRVIVRDTTSPTITCPADVVVSANSGCGATNVALGTPVTADNCAVATVTSNAPSLFNAGTNLVTWTVTDTSGNSNTCIQRVIVRDTTNPTITCPTDVAVSANAGCGATNVALGPPITADNCAVATVTSNAPSLFNAGTNLVTWTVRDTSGNSNTCVQRVIVRDTTSPTITCPADVVVSANSGCGATNVALGPPVTADNCAVATVTSNAPSLFTAGTNLVTWTVTDTSGNSNTCVQRVIVRDTTNPTITCPADVSVSANSGCGASNVALGTPIATDNCAVASVTSNAPSLFSAGTNLVTWTVTDTSGNSNTCVQRVIVRDTTSPTITCPADVSVSANSGCGASNVALGTPIATDNCAVASVTSNAPSLFSAGTNLVTWTVTDTSGNSNTCVQRVIVRDTTSPTITCPADVVVSANSGCGATNVALGPPVTADNCAVATVTSNAPSLFNAGTNLVTWIVTDTSGNSNACVQRVIVRDTTNPTITCPADVIVSANSGCGATNVALGTPITADNCAVALVTSAAPSAYSAGTNLVTWIVRDSSGNSNTCVQRVIVRDTTNPTIVCPADVTVAANAGCSATNVALGPPVTADNCAIATVTSNAPSLFSAGTNLVTWTVKDPSGNSNTCVQRVIVRDTTNPTITCPADVTVSANSGCGATNVALGPPVTADNCAVATVISNAPSLFSAGTNLVTWTVTDTSGNSNTCVQRVIVRDTTNPTITCPADVVVSANSSCGAANVALGTPVTADNCAVASVISNAPAQFSAGTNLVTWTVRDASGNSNTCIQRVIVRDTTNPTITCPADVIVSANSGCGATNVALGPPATADNCAVALVTSAAPSVFAAGTNLVTWTVRDASGNSNTCLQRVIVRDTTNPTITCPPDMIVSANSGCGATNVALGTPVTADNCAVASVASNAPSPFSAGTNLVTWTVRDTSGNSNTCVQRVIIRDTTNPTITCPADVIVSANSGCGATNVALNSPVTSDNCAVATVTSNAPALFNAGTNLVTWTVRDTSGNSNACVQRVIVRDTTNPTITCPADVLVSANSGCGATNVALGTPATADNCAVATVTSNAPLPFAAGTNLVLWTVTDTSGNTAICLQRVVVRDTTAPTIRCPSDLTVSANSACMATNVALGTATANDNCAVALVTRNAPSAFALGTNLVIWTATDTSGNTNTCVQRVIVRDTIPPVIACVSAKTVEAGVGWDFDQPTASDNCGTPVIGVAGTVTNATCGNAFVATRIWRATDGGGNTNVCSQTVTVVDTTAPVINGPGAQTVCPGGTAIFTVSAGEAGVSYQWFNAAGPISGQTTGRLMLTNVSSANGGVYRVVVTDACGNATTNSATLTVIEPPVVSIASPANGSVFGTPGTVTNVISVSGSVIRVALYAGASLIAELTNGVPPVWTYVWQNVLSDDYVLTAQATDQCGSTSTSAPVNVSVVGPVIPVAGYGAVIFNPQTAHWQQFITLTNLGNATIVSVQCLFSNITPANSYIYNASGTNAPTGEPYILYLQPIAPHATGTILVQYYGGFTNPTATVRFILQPTPLPPPDLTGAVGHPINKEGFLSGAANNGFFLLSFSTETNWNYYVLYSRDIKAANTPWAISPVTVSGNGAGRQWIDYGVPATDALPQTQPRRFYRIIKLPK